MFHLRRTFDVAGTYRETSLLRHYDVLLPDINDKDPKFKIGDIVRISKYQSIFAKGYVPNWSEEAFVIKKVKNTTPWKYLISDLKDTHREKALSNKTPALRKSTNMGVWAVGTLNQLFIRGS